MSWEFRDGVCGGDGGVVGVWKYDGRVGVGGSAEGEIAWDGLEVMGEEEVVEKRARAMERSTFFLSSIFKLCIVMML